MKHICRFGLACGLILAGVFLSQTGTQADKPATSVTFTRDVAPLFYKNCVVCHRSGEAAPMSLVSYKEARPWAKSIKEVILERRMPPWYADQRHTEFSNDRRLSQKEIDTIVAWVDGGAKEGDPKVLPPPPKFIEGWSIGKPDAVFSMTEEYNVPAEGVIPYKYFAVPTNFTEDKYVQFAEIRQGNRAVVHHVIVSVREPGDEPLPPPGEIRFEAQSADAQPRQNQQSPRRGNSADGRLIGWAPGEDPLILRPGQAKLIKKGSMLIFQVHYTPTGEPAKDRTSIGLIFSKAPVEKRVITAGAVARSLEIPAGHPNFEVTSSFTFKEDSHIDSLHPHMHVRGKDFEYRLVYPDGKSKLLLSVPRWDFNWQLTYFFKEPVAAPKGSRLDCVAHYDNSPGNKFNPDPTRVVRWGDQTWDEMMIGYLDYTIDSQNLQRDVASKEERGKK